MMTESYKIVGGNFERAGLASRKLKEHLKQLGIEPDIVRRIMIAAYEAEMNVVIHAQKGDMWVTIDNGEIHIEVHDEGPGIPDIDQAMQLGFSTASEQARAMGFGAGMGLPNIKRHSDHFELESTVGQGTRVKSVIFLKNQEIGVQVPHSLRVTAQLCCGCLHCLHTCPTRAIRVRDDQPQILDYLCIDCTACIGVCETGALNMECADALDMLQENANLILPSSFLVQFIPEATPREVLAGLEKLGFASIRFTEGWETALHASVLAYAEEHPEIRPVISPVCPATTNILEMKFPSLLGNVAPFLSPIEAAYDELHRIPERMASASVTFVPACPAQQTMLVCQGLSEKLASISPSALSQAVLPHLHTTDDTREQWEAIPRPTSRLSDYDPDRVLQVSGIRNVLNILEKIETGLLNDVPVLELYACDQGCFGSPLLKEGPFIARFRWLHAFIQYNPDARAVRRTTPFVPRSGLRLAPDMTQAIERLSQIDRITRELPGKNCGMCGAPTCSALAEDIVMGRAAKTACIYMASDDTSG